MKIIRPLERILLSLLFLTLGGCIEPIEQDPCLATKWSKAKEFEIKLAVHVSSANPLLTGGTTGSTKPEDYVKLVVSGTIGKDECDGTTTGPYNLGNTYISREDDSSDSPAPINVPDSYWIGHVVYVYEFDNDEDHLNIDLAIRITMMDGHSYKCNVSDEIYPDEIKLVPMELYYCVLIDVYSDEWIKW